MTIPVKFKRKLSYKHSVQNENVRPNKVIDAANWLVANSQLYRDEGVTIHKTWNESLQQMDDDWQEFVEPAQEQSVTKENMDFPAQPTPSIQSKDEIDPDSDDDWTEPQNDDMQPTGTLDTMLTPEFDEQNQLAYCVAPDEGFRVFRTLRGSPPYWEKSKRELFAMIRQLGIPTWFLSFSAAETRWLHLLKILGRTVNNRHFTDEELLNMNWNDKSNLIKSDPVTCARHFDYMFRRFLNDFMDRSYHPIGEIIDHFYRVEFQQRGSPHIHMLVWVKDAPLYGNAAATDIVSFIDQYVTCNKPPDTVNQTVNLQSHSHAGKRDKVFAALGFLSHQCLEP
ncbi:hypothetical protein BSL78_20468 [Apostichopus japonicus]|uniref:Helitron helicase-like domain-containing protein n=1 Tax=Stichopus japonicus TaxID=307972 RepID=A0A2G8K3T9_STIJA|nr:hypothetical protein BSL78_20468 [Apostichopus japonicus]